jgi:AcrR family transcriptional regulator
MGELQASGRKLSQRERLVRAMIAVVGELGYERTTVALVISRAGVSRPTFYDYFSDKSACFLTALEVAQGGLLDATREALDRGEPERALAASVKALIVFADSNPSMARVAMEDSLAAGRAALDARDRLIVELALLIDDAYGQLSAIAMVPDLSSQVALGALQRLLALKRRGGAGELLGLRDGLLSWIARYERPIGEHRHRALASAPIAHRLPATSARLLSPPPLARGRPRASRSEVLHTQRRRILLALARTVVANGLNGSTVAEICVSAKLDARAFYRQFSNKSEAFDAALELFFQHLMAITASAFSASESWPERIWYAGQAFAEVLEQNPTLAYLALIESSAAGPRPRKRVMDVAIAFTIFLQEGYRRCEQSDPPSQLELEAIAVSSFEIAYMQARATDSLQLLGLLPHVVALTLMPFLGSGVTEALIQGQLE